MSAQTDFKHPPVIEAIAQFNFATPIEMFFGPLMDGYRHIQELYPGEVRLITGALPVPDPGKHSFQQIPPSFRFARSQNDGVCMIWKEACSAHVVSPYPGGKEFMNRAAQLLGALHKVFGGVEVGSVSMRFIDIIDVDPSTEHPSEVLQYPMDWKGVAGGKAHQSHLIMSVSVDPLTEQTIVIDAPSGGTLIRIDMEINRRLVDPTSDAARLMEEAVTLKKYHVEQFRGMIKPKAQERFNV